LQNKLRQTIMVRSLKEDVLPQVSPKTYETAIVRFNPFGIVGMRFGRKLKTRLVLLSKLYKHPKDRELQLQLQSLQESMQHEAGACSFKIDAVVEYLLAQTEKVVVFAYHRGVIEEYAERLRDAGRGVVTLTGDNTRHTECVVEQFQTNPDIQFFVSNMKVGGVGITLTAATLVVFAELDWSPAVMEQAEDRVHRIGQTRPVRIVYFLLDGTLDPIISHALRRKLQVSRQALNPPKLTVVEHQPRKLPRA
jgi:SWI/SNF-related matrix-associated actin-dependent regulator 1 of chromatin subfamily A